jgi:hypothetical protein
MATPDFVLALREKIGHDEAVAARVTAVVLRARRCCWSAAPTAGRGLPSPASSAGREPAVAAEREVLEEAMSSRTSKHCPG